MPNNNPTASRLTHEQIRSKCPPGNSPKEVCCPICGDGHLALSRVDDFKCWGANQCSTEEVAKALHKMMETGSAPECFATTKTSKTSKVRPSETPGWQGLTLTKYCEDKGLSTSWVAVHYSADLRSPTPMQKIFRGKPVVDFAYMDADRKVLFTRFRESMDSKPFSEHGSKMSIPYGLWLWTNKADSKGNWPRAVVVCEGESDQQTLTFHGIPAIGIPGVNNWKPEWARLPILKYAEVLLVVQEPPKEGKPDVGKKFVETVSQSFPERKVAPLKLALKDPSDLHLNVLVQKQFDGDANFLRELSSSVVTALSAKEPEIVVVDQQDLSQDVLDGWLGAVCRDRMGRFPLSFAWPSMLAAAGLFVPPSDMRTNLFAALVGPKGCGKSQAAEHARDIFGLQDSQLWLQLKSGSAEGLMSVIGDSGGDHRLVYPGELSHLLKKANIEGASFAHILNDAYYNDKQKTVMAKQKVVEFSCQLSVLGSLVEEDFGPLFGVAGSTGLYDRFIFGLCPTDFMYDWRPFAGGSVDRPSPVPVRIDEGVLAVKKTWKEQHGIEPRIAEHALRAATICASFDGREILTADALGPALAFAKYQQSVRMLLKPNAGETYEGRLAVAFLDYLDRYGTDGKWIPRSKMYHDTNAYKIGLTIADKALDALEANGDVELGRVGKQHCIRRPKDAT